MHGGILALDLATRTGWAACGSGGRAVVRPLEGPMRREERKSGVRSLARTGSSWGAIFDSFDLFLSDLVTVYAPKLIIFEAPLPRIARGSRAARIAFGLAWQAEGIAHRREIRCYEAHLGSVKKHATGNGAATKQMMIDAAQEHGWSPADDNEADALWLLDFALACEAAQRRPGARAA